MGGGGWLEKLGICLSQLLTKLKLKLKLKLSLIIIVYLFDHKIHFNCFTKCIRIMKKIQYSVSIMMCFLSIKMAVCVWMSRQLITELCVSR